MSKLIVRPGRSYFDKLSTNGLRRWFLGSARAERVEVRSGLLVTALLALTAAFPAAAKKETATTYSWGTDQSCTLKTAKKVKFTDLAGEPGPYAGRCVRINGFWMGGQAIYSSNEGLYLAGGGKWDLDKSVRQHRIGLYANFEDIELSPHFAVADVTVVGVAGTCENRWRMDDRSDEPGEEILIRLDHGYCNYTGGARIDAVSMTVNPRRYTRFIGKKKRKALGNLVFAPEGWPHRAAVEARAAEWRSLIQRREYRDFAALNGIDPADMDPDEARMMQVALKDEGSPFADFHRTLDARLLAIFVEKDPWRDDESDPRDYTAIACYCRTNDCEGRWPISDFDAPSADDRPYICVWLWQYFEGGLAQIGLETLVGPEGFTEKTKK